MVKEQYRELLLQTLQSELSGVVIYTTALKAARDEGLRDEWKRYLDEKGRHIEIVYELFETLGMDREEVTPGRLVARYVGESLVEAMNLARLTLSPEGAEIVACECVVFAETKDHANWQLLAEIAKSDTEADAIGRACEEVEDLYHSKGWCRDLWIASLGMPARIPIREREEKIQGRLSMQAA